MATESDFITCCTSFAMNDDGFFTYTSTEQKRVEDLVKEELNSFIMNSDETDGKPFLDRALHAAYLLKSLRELKKGYTTLDASRTWLCYWAVHALNILGLEIPADLKNDIITFLKTCEHPDGGYGGGPGQLAHLAPTYAAVMALASLNSCEALKSINREKLCQFLLRMKQPNGSFSMHEGGECDMRGAYCGLAVAALTNLLSPEIMDSTAEWIVSCQTYEGGFGGEPGVEAHGGYAYCALAGIAILDKFRLINDEHFLYWLVQRQMKYEGGFQGRTNKLVDGCYSFWQAASFPLVDKEMIRCNRLATDGVFDSRRLEEYILISCQDSYGGLRDKPDKGRDVYHTCYVLSGLSIAQFYSSKRGGILGGDVNKVTPINPVFNITSECEKMATSFFSKL